MAPTGGWHSRALGIVATQAAGLCECLGTPAKSVGVGNAARNGLLSALLAAKDFTGPPEPLTGACKAITMRRTDANPMTDKNLEDKLRDAAAAAIPHNDSAALIDATPCRARIEKRGEGDNERCQ